jgi:uncharacterized protein YjiS (DUF1127 family)
MTLLPTVTYVPAPSLQRRAVALLAGVLRAANSWLATMRAHRERQAALQALQAFSDYQLKDIGLYRGQLDYVVHEVSRHQDGADRRQR